MSFRFLKEFLYESWAENLLVLIKVLHSELNVRRPYVRPSSSSPSTKSFVDFTENWYAGKGRWVMHDGMQYEPIQGQGQGHEPMKVENSAIFNSYLLPHL